MYNHQAITEIPIIEIASEVMKPDAFAIPNSPVLPSRPSASLLVESQSGLLHPLVELRSPCTGRDDELHRLRGIFPPDIAGDTVQPDLTSICDKSPIRGCFSVTCGQSSPPLSKVALFTDLRTQCLA